MIIIIFFVMSIIKISKTMIHYLAMHELSSMMDASSAGLCLNTTANSSWSNSRLMVEVLGADLSHITLTSPCVSSSPTSSE